MMRCCQNVLWPCRIQLCHVSFEHSLATWSHPRHLALEQEPLIGNAWWLRCSRCGFCLIQMRFGYLQIALCRLPLR